MFRIHGGLPELFCVHLSQTFVPLDLVVAVTSHFLEDLIQFFVAVRIPDFFVFLQFVQRRLCQIYISFFDQVRHEPVQEGEQQCTDMGAVHVGIGHDDDLVVSEFADIKVVMDAGPECGDHGLDLGVSVYFIKSCLLYIKDLSPQRQDGLRCTVSGRLRGSAGGISLYDVDLAVFRVLVRAVGKFSRKGCGVKG